MIKHESKSGTRFKHWVHANAERLATSTFEMKDSRGKEYLPWKELKMKQLDYGLAIEEGKKGAFIRTQGGNGEPDYIFLKYVPAYIVIKFPSCFCMIDVLKVWENMPIGQKGSLTVEEAKRIADEVIDLGH